jgi:pimeloyl-ACP methyl ester carboxylesterase
MSDFDPHDFNNLLKTSVNTGIITPTQGIIPQLETNRTLTGVGGQEVKAQSLTPDTSDNIILGDASQTKMTNGTITDTNTSLPDSAVDLITGQAMSEVYGDLSKFAAESDFVAKMNLAFGENWDAAGAKALAEEWFQGDFSAIPPVKVVSSAEIGGANGAFAEATDTIYLSKEFLAGGNLGAIADVLLEEIGHSVDARLNVADSPGDEGAIFAAVVQGKVLSAGELQGLRGEDDQANVVIGGKTISIERASSFDIGNRWFVQAFDVNSGSDKYIGYYDSGSNTRSDGKKGFADNWGIQSPKSDIPKDFFDLAYWTQADFQQGQTYNFKVRADDSYALAAFPVNGNKWEYITQWKFQEDGGRNIQFKPENNGKYWVLAYYRENTGDARFDVSWEKDVDSITVENRSFPVNLSLYDQFGKKGIADISNIDPNKDTVVVIHGRGDGNEDGDIINLAETASDSNYYPNSQVLYLDWKEAANDPGQWWQTFVPYDAAKRIRPVAQWAADRLQELGIDPEKTILLGHSLGSYVASEIGRIGGKVKELVALDPAYPGGTGKGSYDIDGNNPGDEIGDRAVDFNTVATKSIALVASDPEGSALAGGLAGDNEKAISADYSYVVQFQGYIGENTIGRTIAYHKAVPGVFSNILSSVSHVSNKPLIFPSLIDLNRFDNQGKLWSSEFVFERAHEGVISADLLTNQKEPPIKSLFYVDSNGNSQTIWNS